MFRKTTFLSVLIPIVALLCAYLYTESLGFDFVPEVQHRFMFKAQKIFTQASRAAKNMSTTALTHAKIVLRPAAQRGHIDLGWLDSRHTFSFVANYNPKNPGFGSIRVLVEDRVAPNTGFPTHPHREFEIFSYVYSGELTHRDSINGNGSSTASKNDFYIMKRGDVQFTTGGTGIAHSEQNEDPSRWVHFQQVWVKPWATGLPPIYHTATFDDDAKRSDFVTIISPLVGGPTASIEQEKAAQPTVDGTIPIHADLLMGATIVPVGKTHVWTVGGNVASKKQDRNVYVHLPGVKNGRSKIKISGKTDYILAEGDGAFISNLNAGDKLSVESCGTEEAETIVLDSD